MNLKKIASSVTVTGLAILAGMVVLIVAINTGVIALGSQGDGQQSIEVTDKVLSFVTRGAEVLGLRSVVEKVDVAAAIRALKGKE